MKRYSLALLFLACTLPCSGLADLPQNRSLDSMQRWGSGEFRRYGFLIYHATLWAAGDNPTQPPLAMRLTYKRRIASEDIAQVSIDEMRKLSAADETQLAHWHAQLKKLFPDVKPGDQILGVYDEQGARFFHNEKFIGAIASAEFARAFFGIWLDANTSAPELRNALLTTASR